MLNIACRFVEGILKFFLCELRLAECCLRSLHFLAQLLDFTVGLVAFTVVALDRWLMTFEFLLDSVLLLLCVFQSRLQSINFILTLFELLLNGCIFSSRPFCVALSKFNERENERMEIYLNFFFARTFYGFMEKENMFFLIYFIIFIVSYFFIFGKAISLCESICVDIKESLSYKKESRN